MTKLVTTVYKARKRLVDAGILNWSLAVLVPTKKMTRLVPDSFRRPPLGMAEVPHSAVIELGGSRPAWPLLQCARNGRPVDPDPTFLRAVQGAMMSGLLHAWFQKATMQNRICNLRLRLSRSKCVTGSYSGLLLSLQERCS